MGNYPLEGLKITVVKISLVDQQNFRQNDFTFNVIIVDSGSQIILTKSFDLFDVVIVVEREDLLWDLIILVEDHSCLFSDRVVEFSLFQEV